MTACAHGPSSEDANAVLTGPMTGWAAAEAASLLASLPNKWDHTQRVAAHARWAAAGVRPDDRDLLIAAAYLHDIGYAEALVDSGFHPLDGAQYLRRQGLGELACLVAHHTRAHIDAGDRSLTAQLGTFTRPTGPVADALTYSDVTSGPAGRGLDPGERFEEIQERHTTPHCCVLPPRRSPGRNLRNGRPDHAPDDQTTTRNWAAGRSPGEIPITLIDPRGRDRAVLTSIQQAGWPPRIVYGIETVLTPHCAA